MLGDVISATFPTAAAGLAQTLPAAPADAPITPLVLILLCVIAGVGTFMLLPGRRETSWRTIGGIVLLAAGLILAALLVRWTARSAAGGMGVYFWIFATIAIVGALRVITHTRPVYSALYFVLTVFATAGLFVLLWAEFMAAALVLIYAGAILVTYVFVIMLAAEAAPARTAGGAGGAGGAGETGALAAGLAEHDAVSREPLAACAVGFALMGILLFAILDRAEGLVRSPQVRTADAEAQLARQSEPATEDEAAAEPVKRQVIVAGATQELGAFLFENHLVNLELAGLILTLAMVGAIVIARKRVVSESPASEAAPATAGDVVLGPFTPTDDDPHSIPVYGTLNPRQKEYPEA